jgi:hypothetical protein
MTSSFVVWFIVRCGLCTGTSRDCLSFNYNGTAIADGSLSQVPSEWHLGLLKSYKSATPIMASTQSKRRILPNEKGIEYSHGSS